MLLRRLPTFSELPILQLLPSRFISRKQNFDGITYTDDHGTPVYTAPHRFVLKNERIWRKQDARRQKEARLRSLRREKPLILDAGKARLNHYLGQTYVKGEELPLVTKGWGNRRKNGEKFTIRPVKVGECGGKGQLFAL